MRKTNIVNVVDVESTCGDEIKIPEIIQVGIVSVNLSEGKFIKQRRAYIKPIHSHITQFCTVLTGITTADVENAPLFEVVMSELFDEFELSRRPWVSWGDYDREAFVKMSSLYHTRYFFGKTHLNLKNAFSIFTGLSKEVGQKGALERLGMEFEGTQHDGLDDAINAARILLEMRNRRGI